MFLLIIGLIFLFIGILLFFVKMSNGSTVNPGYVRLPRVIPIALIALSLLFMVLASTTIVEAKQVGVVTTFGKPSDRTLASGLHVKAPWQKVTEIDATIQTDEYRGESCITVILADKNTACVSAANRWAVNKTNANDVYADFRSDDPTQSLRDAVVSTQFKAAVFDVFGTYDATLEGAADTEQLATDVKEKMLESTEGLVDIKRVTISYIQPGEKLQNKIESLQAQVSQTRIATEKKKTATEEAAANKILSDSISNDPNVLVSKCLDLIAEGAFTPPAGFSCWPGEGSAVVVPSAR